MKERIILIGSGGHAGVVIDAIQNRGVYDIVGLIDDFVPHGTIAHGYPVVGNLQSIKDISEKLFCNNFHVAVGDNKFRHAAWLKLNEHCLKLITITHLTAVIAANAKIGHGAFIGPFAHVGSNATVGSLAIVNTGANLEHDSHLGFCSHMAPGSMTGGSVTIGERAWVGLGAMIRDQVKVGSDSIVGMGSVVVSDVSDKFIVVGNPARWHNNAIG